MVHSPLFIYYRSFDNVLQDFFYSRMNYLAPSLQPAPHQTFEQEVCLMFLFDILFLIIIQSFIHLYVKKLINHGLSTV